jgi:hypothetical protein
MESNWQFDSRPLKLGIDPIPLHADDMQHTFKKILTRATTLLQTSSPSEVCLQSYGPKSWESQLWQFQDSHLGVPRQKTIWMIPGLHEA